LCRVYTIQPGSHKEITWVHTHNTLHISSRATSAPCSPGRLSLGTALVHRGFITKDTSVCRLICAAIWRPYSTTNEGEVWGLQRTKKPVGLPLTVLTIYCSNKQTHKQVEQTVAQLTVCHKTPQSIHTACTHLHVMRKSLHGLQ